MSRTVLSDSVASFGGGSWADDGRIYFTNSNRGLSSVPATGGAVELVTRADTTHGVKEHDYPTVLPGSRYAVVMLWKGSVAINRVGLVNIATGVVTDLMGKGMPTCGARPGRSGAADGRLLAVLIDLATGRLTGPPMVVLKNVQREVVQRHIAVRGVGQRDPGVSGGCRSHRRRDVGRSDRASDGGRLALTGVLQDVALSPTGPVSPSAGVRQAKHPSGSKSSPPAR